MSEAETNELMEVRPVLNGAGDHAMIESWATQQRAEKPWGVAPCIWSDDNSVIAFRGNVDVAAGYLIAPTPGSNHCGIFDLISNPRCSAAERYAGMCAVVDALTLIANDSNLVVICKETVTRWDKIILNPLPKRIPFKPL